MIDNDENIEVKLNNVLESTPLPVDLRWKVKSNELNLCINEKNLHKILPLHILLQLTEITNTHLQTAALFSGYKLCDNTRLDAAEFIPYKSEFESRRIAK